MPNAASSYDGSYHVDNDCNDSLLTMYKYPVYLCDTNKANSLSALHVHSHHYLFPDRVTPDELCTYFGQVYGLVGAVHKHPHRCR